MTTSPAFSTEFASAPPLPQYQSPRGGSVGRAFKALVLGSLAALGGAIVQGSVLTFFHLNAALVTIFIGYLVGGAVRKGSGYRGGWRYQIMAVLLTYLAIAAAYVPLAIQELRESKDGAPVATEPTGEAKPATAFTKRLLAVAAAKPAEEKTPMTPGQALAALPIALAVAGLIFLALPITAGISSPISLLIFGFGLFRAWQMNKREEASEVTGPHAVGA